jgi:hypothetical protein
MHNISFKEYLEIEEISLVEVSMADISKGFSNAINVPENIVAALYKAFRVMKATAFLAALIYMGFRIEAVRALLPWLAPFIDKAGAAVLALGSGFLQDSFYKLSNLFPELVDWIGSSEVKALSKVGPPVPPAGGGIWSPGVYKGTGY